MLIQRLGYLASRFPRSATTTTTVRTTQQRLVAFSSTANTTTKAATAATVTRPFTILGVQQIAIGSEDRTGLVQLWQGIFGCKVHNSITIATENVEEDILQVGLKQFPVEIDLMTPIDPEKSPKVHKPPLNHIGLWVDDLPRAVDWMKQQGVRFTPGGIRKGAAGYDVTFIHPKAAAAPSSSSSEKDSNASTTTAAPVPDSISGNGVLIELVQAPPEIIAEYTKQL